ncbi:unnamed protein product [Mucor hiemalis]
MRHVRILNLFISSILPKSTFNIVERKGVSACFHCGKFQSSSVYNNNNKSISTIALHQQRYYNSSINSNSSNNSSKDHVLRVDNLPHKKYANANVNSRPAEPSIAIQKLSIQNRPNEALAVYLKLLSEGGFPSREALYQLTRALYKSDNLLGMYAIHDTLLSYYNHHPPSKRGSRAMIYMYTMLIQLITKITRPVDMNTITELCKEMKQFQTCTNIVLYNTLIKTLLQQNQLTQAKALMNELNVQNIQPTIITYGILMKDASRRKDIDSMLNYLDDIEKQPNISPDHAIVSILITTLCDLNEFDKAKDMVEKLHRIDDLVGTKYRQQLLRSIEQRRKKKKDRKNVTIDK